MSIAWPALLRLHGEAELTAFHDQAAWEREMHTTHYLPEDALIDAEGNLYTIQSPSALPIATGQRISLAEVVALVQAHAAQRGDCCVAKFSAASIRDAIEAVSEELCPIRR